MNHDAHLLERFAAGDRTAISEVRSWARAVVQSYRALQPHEADDLEQEVLMALTESARSEQFRGHSSLQTFVRRIARYKCIDRIRARSRRQWLDLESLDEQRPAVAEAREKFRQQIDVEVARKVFLELGEECRQLFLEIEQGLTYVEMSERRRVGPAVLRVRVSRCRKKALELRNRLLRDRSTNDS